MQSCSNHYQARFVSLAREGGTIEIFIRSIKSLNNFVVCSHAMQIRRIVEDVYVPEMQNVVIDGVKIEPPQPLPW